MSELKANNSFILTEKKPREVQIRVYYLRVGDIDTLNEKFFAEILIESKWEEPNARQEFESEKSESLLLEREISNISKYWTPEIFVENVLNDPKQNIHYKIKKEPINKRDESMVNRSRVSGSNQIEFSYWIYEYRRVKGYFFEKLELDYFPLDIQDLSIVVTTFKSANDVKLVKNKTKFSVVNSKKSLDHHIWRLYQHVIVKNDYEDDTGCLLGNKLDFKKSDSSLNIDKSDNDDQSDDDDDDDDDDITDGNTGSRRIKIKKKLLQNCVKHPMIMFQCRAARRSGYFFWNAFFLIFLITSVVFTTFSIDVDKPQFRLPTSATLLLTSITFRWAYSSRCLPTVNYLTSLDKYSISSLVVIYLCLIWHGVASALTSILDLNTAKTIDHCFLGFLVAVYIINHVVMLIWLKAAYAIRKLMKENDVKFLKLKERYRGNKSIISRDEILNEATEKRRSSVIPISKKRHSVVAILNSLEDSKISQNRSLKKKHSISNQFRNFITSVNSLPNSPRTNGIIEDANIPSIRLNELQSETNIKL